MPTALPTGLPTAQPVPAETLRLSPAHAEVVRATLPVVGGAIGEITPRFYRRMFAAHTELERDLFNRGNQAQGEQQKALAGAIAMYATLLVDEDGPDPRDVLARIAHKHASLGITRDQYPIVHEHLFAAIVDVLGDAVTPEVAAAWDAVYWHMAEALIEIEDGLYREAGVAAGEVWRTVRVAGRTQESPDTVTFVLRDPSWAPLPAARPGQYVSVAVRLPDGARQIRQYSLTGAGEPQTWSISVKAVPERLDGTEASPAGEVSTYLHDHVFAGDLLEVSTPFGDLELVEGNDPLLLVSAGIGVTPMLGFLHHLRRTGDQRDVTVLHADRSPERHARRAELQDLVAQLPSARLVRWYEDLGGVPAEGDVLPGLIDLANLALPDAAHVYLCGPVPFMRLVDEALTARGVPSERIHFEVFGPGRSLA